eukprot:6214210-Pleurochrysis_carterae.AAC.7
MSSCPWGCFLRNTPVPPIPLMPLSSPEWPKMTLIHLSTIACIRASDNRAKQFYRSVLDNKFAVGKR